MLSRLSVLHFFVSLPSWNIVPPVFRKEPPASQSKSLFVFMGNSLGSVSFLYRMRYPYLFRGDYRFDSSVFEFGIGVCRGIGAAWVLWRLDGLSPLSCFIGVHNMIFAERCWCRLASLEGTTFGLAGPLTVCRTTVLLAVIYV